MGKVFVCCVLLFDVFCDVRCGWVVVSCGVVRCGVALAWAWRGGRGVWFGLVGCVSECGVPSLRLGWWCLLLHLFCVPRVSLFFLFSLFKHVLCCFLNVPFSLLLSLIV